MGFRPPPTGGTATGLPSNFQPKTGAYTAAAGDFVLADATGGAFTVTLPAGTAGQMVTVKKVDASANAVAVVVTGGGSIDGDTSGLSISVQHWGALLECSAPGVWRVVSPTAAGMASMPDASTSVKGASKLSTAPVSSTNPIAVGDNDARMTDQRVPTDASVTAAKVAGSLKPSSTAVATDESLRRLGTGSTHAAAGDDSRFPTPGQKNALSGTNGTPGTGNEYLTVQAKGAAFGVAPLDSNSRVPITNLASGTPDGTKFVRDDGTLATPAGGGGGGGLLPGQVAPRIFRSPRRRAGKVISLDPAVPLSMAGLFEVLGVNAVHTVSITGTPTGGSFTATLADGRVITIPYNATAVQLAQLLGTLYGPSNVLVTGGPLPGANLVVEYVGRLAGQQVPAPTLSSAGLTGGTTPTAAWVSTTAGGANPWTASTDASDSSRAVLVPDPNFKKVRVLTKDTFRDFEAHVRFRSTASPHVSSGVELMGRYLSPADYFFTNKSWQPASPNVGASRRSAGASASISGASATQADMTGSAIWHGKLRMVGSMLWAKWWKGEEVTLSGTATGVTSTDTFTKSAHGLTDGTIVLLSVLSGGSGLSIDRTYFVVNATANTFQLALTAGGAAVDLGSDVTSVKVTRDVEPDWQIVRTVAPTGPVNDEVQTTGQVGIVMSVDGTWMLSALAVTELLPVDDSMAVNGDFQIVDTNTNLPIGWSQNTENANSVNSGFEDVAGPDGVVRRFARVSRTADDPLAAAMFLQQLYRAGRSGRARQAIENIPDWANAIEVELSSKGVNVQHITAGSDFLGFGVVIYHYTEAGTQLNSGVYYSNLGPDIAVNVGGDGTWDWFRQAVRVPLKQGQRIDRLDVSIGLHDSDVTGDVWFGDVEIRPVA